MSVTARRRVMGVSPARRRASASILWLIASSQGSPAAAEEAAMADHAFATDATARLHQHDAVAEGARTAPSATAAFEVLHVHEDDVLVDIVDAKRPARYSHDAVLAAREATVTSAKGDPHLPKPRPRSRWMRPSHSAKPQLDRPDVCVLPGLETHGERVRQGRPPRQSVKAQRLRWSQPEGPLRARGAVRAVA